MALINTTTTGVLGTTVYGDGAGALTVQQDGVQIAKVTKNPTFRMELRNNTSFTSGSWTKVPLNTIIVDTEGCCNTSTYRFTPNIAGYYAVQGSTRINTASQIQCYGGILKNDGGSLSAGSVIASAGVTQATNGNSSTFNFSTVVYMNGTTDYLCLWIYGEGSAPIMDYNSIGFCNYLSGSLIKAT